MPARCYAEYCHAHCLPGLYSVYHLSLACHVQITLRRERERRIWLP